MARMKINRAVRVNKSARDEDVMTHAGREPSSPSSGNYGQQVLDGIREEGKCLNSMSHYEIVRTLGEGGMGTVFLAHHVSAGGIRKEVAIKVLKDTADERAIGKFVEEAQLLASLSQGTVVELLALENMEIRLPARKDRKSGRILPPRRSKLYYMVQEFVNGPSLENVLEKLHENVLLMAPPMVGFILNKTAIALAEAHTLTDSEDKPLNLVHRDISPSNILFNAKAGITKLADFGVAKAFSEKTESDAPRLVGKPRYMSPEQLDGYATAASDIWALGVIGYECLTGFGPYRLYGESLADKAANMKQQLKYTLRAPKEVLNLPAESRFNLSILSDIIMRCLRHDPQERPTSLELNAMLEGEYLYSKGLGPTNKTLAALLRLLDFAAGGGSINLPPTYMESEDSKVLNATLWLQDPANAVAKRTSGVYNPEFVSAVKFRHANPCLIPNSNGPFVPN
ncbi:MAG: serine/threonine protein kinase [Planctomycetes bacterium]|nr:serine/threonine protein kinase [Planctomycetota bacterium]